MIQLPHGCWCSGTEADPKKGTLAFLHVFPKNWRTSRASVRKNWYIQYRFYDPSLADGKYPKGKLVIRESKVNALKTLAERQIAMDYLVSAEMDMLLKHGYNPITETMKQPPDQTISIEADTLFIPALQYALDNMEGVKESKADIASALTYITKAATELKFHYKCIAAIKKKEIKILLSYMKAQNISKIEKDGSRREFTSAKYNRYRAYLSMLFSVLEDIDVIEYNPVMKVKKLKKIKRIRLTLSAEEWQRVEDHLYTYNRDLWRFKNIFYHSGARKTELLSLKGKDVELQGLRFKVLIKKGPEYREVFKRIKLSALPYWEEQLKDCGREDYVFSTCLKPGKLKLGAQRISKLWKFWVKDPLNIEADFYALKHLHTTNTVDEELRKIELAQRLAAEQNSHLSTSMVAGVYDIKSRQRLEEMIQAK